MRGKNPRRQQKNAIKEVRLNPDNWLVLKSPTNELHIQHRESKELHIIDNNLDR